MRFGYFALLVPLALLGSGGSAFSLPSACDALPGEFKANGREIYDDGHRDALSFVALPGGQDKNRRAGAAVTTMQGVFDRVVQKFGQNSAAAATARFDLGDVLAAAVESVPFDDPQRNQMRERAVSMRREAFAMLRRTATAPVQIDHLAEIGIRFVQNSENKVSDGQAFLADVLAKHRRLFGDIPRQWPLWESAIGVESRSAVAVSLRRQRVAAADAMKNQRAKFEARLKLLSDLWETKTNAAEAIGLARDTWMELAERAQKDLQRIELNPSCSWVSPTLSLSHMRVVGASGTEEERSREAGLVLRHQALGIEFETEYAGTMASSAPIVEGRYVDADAYRDAMRIAATKSQFLCGDAWKLPIEVCAIRTIAMTWAAGTGQAVALQMYRDGLEWMKGQEAKDPANAVSVIAAAAETEWRHGTSTSAEPLLARALELAARAGAGIDPKVRTQMLQLQADIADARLDDRRTGEIFKAIVERALQKPSVPTGSRPPGTLSEEETAYRSAASDLVARHLRRRFCVDCGPEVPALAARWLRRYDGTGRKPAISNVGEAPGRELVLLRTLQPELSTPKAWAAYANAMSEMDQQWKKIIETINRRLPPKSDLRGAAEIAALYYETGGLIEQSGSDQFVTFLLEKDLNRKRQLWRSYFQSIQETNFEQFGSETLLYETLDSVARDMYLANFHMAGRVVHEYLVEELTTLKDSSPGGAANLRRTQDAFATLLVPATSRLAGVAAEAKDWTLTARYLDLGETVARRKLMSEWRAGNERSGSMIRDLRPALRSFAQTRTRLAADPATRTVLPDAPAKAFEALQLAMLGETAVTMQAAQRRRLLSNPAVIETVRRRDEARQTVEAISTIEDAAGFLSPTPPKMARERAMAARTEADTKLRSQLPVLEDVGSLMPSTLVGTQKLLAQGEAAVLLHVGSDAVYGALVATNTEPVFWMTKIAAKDLEAKIRAVRAGVDVGSGTLPFFPFEDAAFLYDILLGPARGALGQSSSLVVLADGPLQSLPLGVLLTKKVAEPPSTPDGFRTADLSWMIRQHSIGYLTSIRSLEVRGQQKLASRAPVAFAGIGNPVLSTASAASRTADFAGVFASGPLANVDALRSLASLPETEVEIVRIGKLLGGDKGDMLLGTLATEAAVKTRDLSRYRVLAFATHALVGGDAGAASEPGLVMTPPPRATALDDGLLTASEISDLKLDADLVILSACNTAASDGRPRAEGLTGLARAFLRAGARGLLVTHWSIPSAPAVEITTRMVAARRGEPALDWAQALRKASLAVIEKEGPPEFAHPANWGAFAVVGAQR